MLPAKYRVRSELSIAYKPYHLSTVECVINKSLLLLDIPPLIHFVKNLIYYVFSNHPLILMCLHILVSDNCSVPHPTPGTWDTVSAYKNLWAVKE